MSQPAPKLKRDPSDAIRPPKDKDDRVYPCARCGKPRSQNEGGMTFTVCDDCWDIEHPEYQEGPMR